MGVGGRGITGGIWILREVMIVKYMAKFHAHNLGWSGYFWMYVCSVLYVVLSLMEEGELPKFGADLEGVYST